MSSVGVNLTNVGYGSAEHPFIDRMKTAGPWSFRDNAGHTVSGAAVLDDNGYVSTMPSGGVWASTAVGIDPIAEDMTDRYVITYEGDATFSFQGGTVISSEPGRIVVKATGWTNGDKSDILVVNLHNNSSDYAHDIHVVREDQVDLFAQGEVFNPTFLDRIDSFDTLRTLNWTVSNSSQEVNWNDRTTVDDFSWNGGIGTVPIEILVKLANDSHTDMWYNLPYMASDDYVEKAMTYIHEHLDPALQVHVEYANEVWNWGFAASHYAADQADQLWGKDLNGDGVINSSGAEHVGDGWVQFYGYRSAQVAAIAKDVFGDDAQQRLLTVLAPQTWAKVSLNSAIAGAQKADLGSIADLFDSLAITGYFGGQVDGFGGASDRAKVVEWAHSGAAGLDAAFAEMEHGGALSSNDSLDKLVDLYQYYGAVAASYGMTLDVYEGNAHLVASAYDVADRDTVVDFFARLVNDSRMADLYEKNLDAFEAAGGNLFEAYTDVGGAGMYGYWGLLDGIYDDLTERWEVFANHNADKVVRQNLVGTSVADNLAGADNGDQVSGLAGDDVLNGMAGSDFLIGGAGKDTLNGGDGNDLLDGGTGIDRMIGGAGNDIYVVDDKHDVVVEDAAGGIDMVRVSATSYVLSANVEALNYTGTKKFTGTGNDLANTINGGKSADKLYGMAGNDSLNGGNGIDRLDGGTGADVMVGGKGSDIYFVDDVGDRIFESEHQGSDQVRTTLNSYNLPDFVGELRFIGTGNFVGNGTATHNTMTGGAGNDMLNGLGGNDDLFGGAGNDTLRGDLGNDKMMGGAGDDTFVVDSAKDKVVELAGEGNDLVYATVTHTLAANVERLILDGSAAIDGTGNASDNTINGNAANNVISGLAGADTLVGMAGNDELHGGDDADNLQGRDGTDVLWGDAGNDRLDGGTGADELHGGTGDDTYYVDSTGDVVVEGADAGADTVIANVDYVLGSDVEILFIGGASSSGTGNGLDNSLSDTTALDSGGRVVALDGMGGNDHLYGSSNANLLSGGSGDDTIIAGAGDDVVNGGSGLDQLYGNAGADRYVFRDGDSGNSIATADKVSFSHAEGDRIDLSAMDAITGGGDNAFSFIGTGSFSGTAGELRYGQSGGYFQLMGDTNGDGASDFVINLTVGSNASLVVADIIL